MLDHARSFLVIDEGLVVLLDGAYNLVGDVEWVRIPSPSYLDFEATLVNIFEDPVLKMLFSYGADLVVSTCEHDHWLLIVIFVLMLNYLFE